MVTPISAPAAPAAPLAPPLSAVFVLDPQAASAAARVRPTAAVANFATLIRYSFGCGTGCGWQVSTDRSPGGADRSSGTGSGIAAARGVGAADRWAGGAAVAGTGRAERPSRSAVRGARYAVRRSS